MGRGQVRRSGCVSLDRHGNTGHRRRRDSLRRRLLRLEWLEPRVLLAAAEPHELFDREVFPGGGAYSDFAAADVNRDGAPDLIAVNGELRGEISVLLGDGAGHFEPRAVYAAGKYPLSVAAADLNGDGFVDLVAGNTGSYSDGYERTVSVLLGRGDGTFLTATKLDTGGRPRAVAIADFSGDSKADILTVNTDDTALGNSYSLLAGNGDGTFAARVDRKLSFAAEDVAAGDLNGDGRQDLVIGRGQAVTVLLGQGGGAFAAGVDCATAAQGYVKVAIADMNGDSKPDVVTSGEYPGSISVLLGGGDGTLAVAAEYAATPRPRSLAIADVNADSLPDVIIGSWQDGYVGVRLGQGGGSLGDQVGYWAGGMVSAVAVADFDQDGRLDIAADNSNDKYVAVLPGLGGGRFAAPRTLWPTSANPTAVDAADLNGDGVRDLVTMDKSSRVANVVLGAGGGVFAAAVAYPIGFSALAMRLADFNADGRPDLLVTNNYQTVSVRLNLGDGTFSPSVDYTVNSSGSSSLTAAQVADVNGDGRLDILVADTSVAQILALYGAGNGTFAAATTLVSQADPLVALADFNGDGAVDLVTSQFPAQTVYLNRGDGTFGQPTRYTLGSADHPTQLVATGDVNGDDNPDLVVSGGLYNGSDRDLWVMLGRGDGTFAAATMTTLPIDVRPVFLKLADVNGDGRDELISDRGGTRVAVLVADAGGRFRMHAEYDLSDSLSDVSVGDFDGDGAADLALPSPQRAGVTVLAGHGDGTFGGDFEYSQSGSPSGVAVGDLNGDGNADYVSANGNGHTVSVRLGLGDGRFSAEHEFHVGPHPGDVGLGDFNRDGVLDVVVAHRDPAYERPAQFDSVSVAFGVGDGTFGPPTEMYVQGVPVVVRAVDVNGDGADDIVTANARASFYDPVSVLLSNGDRTFRDERSFRAGAADPKDLAAGDLNGDGWADVVTVTGTDSSGTATILWGGGDGSFPAPEQLAVARGALAVALGDLNGDGYLDLVTGNSPSYLDPGSSVSVLLGRGDGTFEARVDYAVDGTPQQLRLADMNGDDKLDVVATHGTGGTFSIGLGRGDGTFAAGDVASFALGDNANLRSFGIGDFDGDGKSDLAVANADRTGVLVALQAGLGPWPGSGGQPAEPLPAEDALGIISPHAAADSYTGPTVSGTISVDTTWSGVVVVRGPVTVATGVTLTVQSGTTVKFMDGAGLYAPEPGRLDLNGTLRVVGTELRPVVFTALADDSAGGDTNGDGAASGANAGEWAGVRFHAGATASSLSYAEFRWAGDWSSGPAVQVDGGTPSLNHVTIRDALARGLTVSGTAGGTFSGLTVQRTGGTGIEVTGSLPTTLTDVVIDGTGLALGIGGLGDSGLSVTGAAATVHNVHVRHVPGWALDISMATWPRLSGLVIDPETTGHAGAVNVTGTLTADCAPAADVTWSIDGTVSAGVTLTLAPGTVLKGSLTVLGTLDARGTADLPIIVSGTGDDSVGGDTNGDGNASHPRESLSGPRLRFFDTGADGSVLEYVEVRYGGGSNWSGTRYAAVEIEKASPRLTNLTIRDTDNWALLLKQDAGPVIEHLTVENGLGASSSDGYGVFAQSDAGPFTLADVSFRRVTNWPLYLDHISQWGRVADVHIDAATCARGVSAYVAGGTLASDVRPAAGVAWQLGSLTVPAGRTLTLDPGTILKTTSSLSVAGILNAAGTPTLPVVITVPTDDSVGGDTDVDGGATAPGASSSPWLAVLAGGSATLESVELRYRGLDVTSATAVVTSSRLVHAPQQLVRIGGGAGTTANVSVANSLLVRDGPDWEVVAGFGPAVRLTLVNSTIVGGSYGVLLDQNARLERLVNNIVAFHWAAGVALTHGGSASTDVRHNDVYNPGATVGNYMNMQDYTGLQGNVSAEPWFADAFGGDFRLGDGSAAVDAADGDAAPLRDRAGLPRFDDWGVPDTGRGTPGYADMGCHERVADSTSPIDLVVVADSITGPPSVTVGQTVTVEWTIQNVGTEPALGPWHDVVSVVSVTGGLSGDALPAGSRLNEFLTGDGVTLLPGETLAVSAQVTVPPAAIGEYYWQVQTNSRLEVREGTNRLNNAAHGTAPVQVAVPELQLGVPAGGTLAGDGDARYYAVRVTAGQPVVATLDDADNLGANELYVRFGELPTRSNYDRHSVLGATADRRLQFTPLQSGYAYLLVYGRQVPAASAAFQITAALPQFGVDGVVPAEGGNVGQVTVAIRGAAIPANVIAYLEGADGQRVFAWPVQVPDPAEVYATFDLTGQAPGLYDVVLHYPGADDAVLTQGFAVQSGTGPRLETTVTAPEEVRRGWIFPVTMEWANTGDVDMASPLLKLSNPAELPFSPDPFLETTLGSEIEFVGYSTTGPAGVLQPGDRESVTLWALASAWVSRYDFTLGAVTEATGSPATDAIPWAALEPLYRPPVVTDEAGWSATWEAFTGDLGSTWTDVVRRLAGEVTRTGVPAAGLPLVGELMHDTLARAAGWNDPADPTLAEVVSATPGYAVDGSLHSVQLDFNKSIKIDTLAPYLQLPNGSYLAPTSVSSIGSRRYVVTFPPQSKVGYYKLDVPICFDLGGKPGKPFNAWLRVTDVDPAVLQVVSISPDTVAYSKANLQAFEVQFNHPVEAATFTAADVSLGPSDVAFTVVGVRPISSTRFAVLLDPPVSKDSLGLEHQSYDLKFTVGPGIEADEETTWWPMAGAYADRIAVQDDVGPFLQAAGVAESGTEHASNIWADSSLGPAAAVVSWVPYAVDELSLFFSEYLADGSYGPGQFRLSGPNGPIPIGQVTFPGQVGGSYQYRLSFPKQTDEGDYVLEFNPSIRDAKGNFLDQDRDGIEHLPEDLPRVKFRIVPEAVVVEGSVNYARAIPALEGWELSYAVSLWEQVGDPDPIPGVPEAGDAADYPVSRRNEWTGTGYATHGLSRSVVAFAFRRDLDGELIRNQDPRENDEPRQLYVVLTAATPWGAFVAPDSLTTVSHADDPTWVTVRPEPLPDGVQQEWARAEVAARSEVFQLPEGDSGGLVRLEPLDFNATGQAVYAQYLDWLQQAEVLLQPSGANRGWTCIRPFVSFTDEYRHDAEHDVVEVITGPGVRDAASFWQAYAHAAQFAAQGRQPLPYDPRDAGAIWESGTDSTAWLEGVASALAGWLLEPGRGEPGADSVVTPRSWYRTGKYLAQNDFWMGFDGYGLAQNADAADTAISPGRLRADGVNNNANTGDNVAGGIASLLWQLGPEFIAPALAAQTAAEFYAAVAEDSSAVSAFLDQGLAVADDRFEPNDVVSAAKTLPIGTTLVDNLILAETDAGQGDWFRLRIPAAGVSKTYALTARVRFTGRQGDLDLVVRTGDGQLVAANTSRGGDSALIHLTGLDAAKTYDFLIGVFGHGALLPSGDPSPWGGDYSPYYMLQFSYPGHILPYRPQQTASTVAFQSWDPNEKVGPAAAGAGRYVHESTALPYTVYFENDPELATVPAQRVVITDQLDSDLDWSSFQFGPIQFGDTVIQIPDPAGRLHFETDTTVAYDAYPVHVTADLNPETGVLTWELRSVDPQSGGLPRDLLAGFLPPNDDSGRGEGYVSYSVRLKPGLVEGVQIRNQASIVFDFNDPIITNEVVYAIDVQRPSSAVSPLDPTTPWLTFPVAWSGSDSGAGIDAYDVYVSDNGGTFQPWLAATPLTTAAYTGQSGHSYAFYSVAIDGVGHREAAPANADTLTSVVVPIWHNALLPWDVDGSQRVDAADVLTVINYINSHPGDPSLPAPPASGPPYYDVDDSGDVTPQDVLLAINYINSHLSAAGEGEFAPALLPTAGAASRLTPPGHAPRPAADAKPGERARGDASLARWTASQAAASPSSRVPPRRVSAGSGELDRLADEFWESLQVDLRLDRT